MGRAKIKRGSTNIDMTAMCDVAFLLLSFFILTTKFKPSEAIDVVTPNSVASKAAPETDAFTVSLDKAGKVYIDMAQSMKADVFDEVNTAKNLGLTPEDKKLFSQATFVGVPFGQLKQFLRIDPENLKNTNLSGIPVDSSNNELQAWINAVLNAYKGRKQPNFLIKGDNNAKYTSFKGIISAFKKNEIFKYLLVTNPEGVPPGTALYENNMHPAAPGTTETP